MKKAISDGTVDANWAIQALVEGIEDGTDGMAGQTAKMGGMMGELKNTFKGACDSMTSSIRNFGLAVVGEYGTTDAESSKFLGSLTRIVQQATAIIDAASKKWSDAGLSIEPMASAVGDALEKIAGGIEMCIRDRCRGTDRKASGRLTSSSRGRSEDLAYSMI